MLLAIFSFFTVFMLSYKNIYLSNIVFFILFYKSFSVRNIDRRMLFTFLLFELCVIVSTLVFISEYGVLSNRILTQFLFTSQYIIFCFYFDSQTMKKIIVWSRAFGYILSIYIIVVLLFTGTYKLLGSSFLSATNRMWGFGYIPQWPNGIPLSLVFILWIELREESPDWLLSCLCGLTAILTTSRIGLLGTVLVVFYFLLMQYKLQSRKVKIIIVSAVLLLSFFAVLLILNNTDFSSRLLSYKDRGALWSETMNAIKNRPILGYGGNTLDVYSQHFPIDEENAWLMTHTHNTVLEISLRYGIPSVLLFSIFLMQGFSRINTTQNRFMFILLMLMSLFQIFIRDFIFLFYLIFLMNEGNFSDRKNEGVSA